MSVLTKLRHTPVLQGIWNRMILRKVTACEPRSPPPECPPPPPECPPPKQTNQNWVSYGFHYENQEEDTNIHHASYFFTITLCIIFGGFVWAYSPDVCLRDWAQREAFLELRRREAGGLPPIDPNYVPVSKVTIPSQQELCDLDFDIII